MQGQKVVQLDDYRGRARSFYREYGQEVGSQKLAMPSEELPPHSRRQMVLIGLFAVVMIVCGIFWKE